MGWDDIIKLFLVGAFPWISEFKRLEIHFNVKGFNLSAIYNFFASLFACALFTYSYFVSPYQLVSLPPWWVFMLISFILIIVYFIIFFFYSAAVNEGKRKPLVIVNFISYVLIFCCLTIGFAEVKLFKQFHVLSGRVVDKQSLKPIPYADVVLQGEAINQWMDSRTNKKGGFTFFIDSASFKMLKKIRVTAVNYETDEKIFLGESSIYTYSKSIEMNKVNN